MDESSERVLTVLNRTYPLKLLTDEQKTILANQAVVEQVAAGQLLYREHEEALSLYLILSGQVHLYWLADEEDAEAGEISLGDLEAGDIIGLEAMEEESTYDANAVALTAVRVARFSFELLDSFFEENPYPYQVLRLMLKSFKLFLKLDLSWRNPQEAVIFLARRNPVFLVFRLILPLLVFVVSMSALLLVILLNPPGMFLVGLVGGVFALLSGLVAIWNYVDWSNDYAIITNQRAVFQERVIFLYDSRLETPLDAILATSLTSSQLGRIFGYGDVVMKTYTGTLIFPDLARWEMVRSLVDDRRARARETNLQQEKQNILSMVRGRIVPQPPAPPASPAGVREPRQIPLGERIANFFRMRSESNDVITYRTHWSILIRKIFLPGLLMLGLFAMIPMRLVGTITILSGAAFWMVWLILVLVDGFWLWYRFEDWVNDKYIVSNEQIIDVYKKPLGQEEKRVAPLKSIQSVEFERLGLIGLVLNYGTVYIRIGDTRFSFDNVYNPSEVQRDLFRRIAAQASGEKQREVAAERGRILDMIEAYHTLTHAEPLHPWTATDTGEKADPPPPAAPI